MTIDVMANIRPRDESSNAYRDAVAQIGLELLRIDTEQATLKAERGDMLVSGASNADLREIEKAIADLDLDLERLQVAEPIMNDKLTAAIAREAEEARRDKAEC
jgi:hypothetical protein